MTLLGSLPVWKFGRKWEAVPDGIEYDTTWFLMIGYLRDIPLFTELWCEDAMDESTFNILVYITA